MLAARSRPNTEEARVSIAGVDAPILGRVDRRTPSTMTLARDLSLLRVGTTVRAEDGRVGRIDGVWIAMDGVTPTLCVDIAYEKTRSPSGRPPAVRADATLGYEDLAAAATGRTSGVRARSPREDDTNRDATLAFASEPPPPMRAPAPIVLPRRTALDRLLFALEDLVDRWRKAARAFWRRSSFST